MCEANDQMNDQMNVGSIYRPDMLGWDELVMELHLAQPAYRDWKFEYVPRCNFDENEPSTTTPPPEQYDDSLRAPYDSHAYYWNIIKFRTFLHTCIPAGLHDEWMYLRRRATSRRTQRLKRLGDRRGRGKN